MFSHLKMPHLWCFPFTMLCTLSANSGSKESVKGYGHPRRNLAAAEGPCHCFAGFCICLSSAKHSLKQNKVNLLIHLNIVFCSEPVFINLLECAVTALRQDTELISTVCWGYSFICCLLFIPYWFVSFCLLTSEVFQNDTILKSYFCLKLG